MEKYPVSKTKLYEELKRRDVTPAQASKEMGFSGHYLANVALNGEIPARGALYLERCYQITPEDYQPDLLDEIEQTKAKQEQPETIPNEFIQAAAETFAKTFRETIKNAVIEALRERAV